MNEIKETGACLLTPEAIADLLHQKEVGIMEECMRDEGVGM